MIPKIKKASNVWWYVLAVIVIACVINTCRNDEVYAEKEEVREDWGRSAREWDSTTVAPAIERSEISDKLEIHDITGPEHPPRVELEEIIPTWPDYIELPNDLVIEYEYDTGLVTAGDDGSVVCEPYLTTMQYVFPKGMKIYFKEGTNQNEHKGD